MPAGVLPLLCIAPALDRLSAITGSGAVAVLALRTARVALLIAGAALCARDQPVR